MFELSIALKYLIPRKKHLSVTLIAMMSLMVISLVVWLLLVFLSVTEGMEKNWLKKLTTLSAPIRITPKEAYFSSYYHQIDTFSGASNFSPKTLGEKLLTSLSDPYNPEEDPELPYSFPSPDRLSTGEILDPVKGLYTVLENIKKKHKDLYFQDYEMSGAMLKVQMLRKGAMHFLTQVSYLSTPPKDPTLLSSLLMKPSKEDINHLFFLAGYHMEGALSDEAPKVMLKADEFRKEIQQLLSCISIDLVKCSHLCARDLPKELRWTVWCPSTKTSYSKEWIIAKNPPKEGHYIQGFLIKDANGPRIIWGKEVLTLEEYDRVKLDSSLSFTPSITEQDLMQASHPLDLFAQIKGKIENETVTIKAPWSCLSIEQFTAKDTSSLSSPWPYRLSEKEIALPSKADAIGILLPKTFHDSGVLLGDRGFLSYASSTTSAVQELRTPIFVAGFYDPGIFSVGNKCLLVPSNLTKTINSSNTSFQFDKIATNGFQVWFDSLSSTNSIQKEIQKALEERGLSSYFEVTPFYEYEFAKDLMQQFRSDRYLFSLVGIIILLVACSNIVSFLILLVNDKKREIAILQSMGASKLSIISIFGFCGLTVGLIGAFIGIFAGVFTLHNIDAIASILSQLQGHDAFSQTFYGTSLPSALSFGAILLIGSVTPILSLLAAMIPAWKASKLQPSTLLRR